ncbi:MAG: LacI family transcriptional regulator [Candidatus Omnitrophica bacterium]|nr:LacI family transcriptional regulator [Candidatus Omnitrophota bacterium]
MKTLKRRVSLKDIAERAGVSKIVVYTVLKGKENQGIFVGKKTKEKILQIANELGYVAPKSAKELFTGKSDSIGIICHQLTPYFSKLIESIQLEALRNGLDIIPYLKNGDWKLEEHYLNLCRDGRVDGVITVAHTGKSVELYKKYSNPPYNLKILSYGPPIEGIYTIHFDEEKAGRLAAQHLIQIGCKKIAFFGGSKNFGRFRGFYSYLIEKGIEPMIFMEEKLVASYEAGVKLAKGFFQQIEDVDGVFAFNDLVAAALIKQAYRHGLRIPDDLAVIGCDNTDICLYTEPSLTSIDTNIQEIAKKSINIIKKIIDGEKVPMYTKIDVNLVERESTGKKTV